MIVCGCAFVALALAAVIGAWTISDAIGKGLACLIPGVAAIIAGAWWLRPRWTVQISQAGVLIGRQFIEWPSVWRIAGKETAAGVCIIVTAGHRFDGLAIAARTRPLLSRDEYDRLIGRLRPFLAEQYPHVEVDAVPTTRA
jgi:hypothetical protein